MQQASLNHVFRDIMLLSNTDRQELYYMMERELFQDNKIVAYTTTGKPLLQKQYVEKIERAIAEADRNELIADDDLEKEITTW